ncbi:uncharacterized protein C8Q71DRAFT_196637 [Rhodofomes roseus]|uniref:Uncharacterized protein n=1 Tax=Rhodofomes roseus TaxID=34475 RepID=A0ABQ8K7R0_9APHY|nr:uncharacterized protein C8Q71DRAFT_196637 [Rhodofomes roseus]KAH9833291.1 hypothetical protein C8Q71DRAFT_196637 [Rhodofomes roseus]
MRSVEEKALRFEDLRLRIHAFNCERAAVTADLMIKHARLQSQLRTDATTAAAYQMRAWRDYYTASKAAGELGEEIPRPVFPATLESFETFLPDISTLLKTSMAPYSPGWINLGHGQSAPEGSSATTGSSAATTGSSAATTGSSAATTGSSSTTTGSSSTTTGSSSTTTGSSSTTTGSSTPAAYNLRATDLDKHVQIHVAGADIKGQNTDFSLQD